jgi:hypothetical protein
MQDDQKRLHLTAASVGDSKEIIRGVKPIAIAVRL